MRATKGADILIMARTDARACVSLEEAIARCQMFREIGADITFLEAPLDEGEMRRYCEEVDGPKMANLIEGGKTPILPPRQLEAIGYKIAVYPLTLLNVSIQAMRSALSSLAQSERPAAVMDFEDLKKAVGFPAHYAEEARYGGLAGGSPAKPLDSTYFCAAAKFLKNSCARWFISSGVRSSFRVAMVQR